MLKAFNFCNALLLYGLAVAFALSGSVTFGGVQNVLAHLLVLGTPDLATCPTSNCPTPPDKPVLSSVFVHGQTTKGADQAEWLSNIGLLVGSGSPNGQKVTQYLGVMQKPGAGTAWTLNTDLVRNAETDDRAPRGFEGSGRPSRPGAIGAANGSIGYELDFTNWDANSSPGKGAFTVGEYIHAQGSYTSLSAIYMDANMDKGNKSSGWAYGILFNGDRLISDNTIFDASSAVTSLAIAGHHSIGISTTQSDANLHAIVLKAGQTACYNELSACLSWQDGKLSYKNGSGKTLFSIDDQGNAIFSGHVISTR